VPDPASARRLPTIRQNVLAFLAAHPGEAYCSGCVEAAIGATAVDVAMREVEGHGVRRRQGPCAGCGKLRLVSSSALI
jgi:hypothetical protein